MLLCTWVLFFRLTSFKHLTVDSNHTKLTAIYQYSHILQHIDKMAVKYLFFIYINITLSTLIFPHTLGHPGAPVPDPGAAAPVQTAQPRARPGLPAAGVRGQREGPQRSAVRDRQSARGGGAGAPVR